MANFYVNWLFISGLNVFVAISPFVNYKNSCLKIYFIPKLMQLLLIQKNGLADLFANESWVHA